MIHQVVLQGLSSAQLEQLHTHLACAFWDDISEETRDAISSTIDTVKNCLPASFVLASLFDVEAMSLDIPDHVYESDPSLEWVTCPGCAGEGYEVQALTTTEGFLTSCEHCKGGGEVLDDLATSTFILPSTKSLKASESVDALIAKVERLLMARRESKQLSWRLAA
jgi:hypothetical protein